MFIIHNLYTPIVNRTHTQIVNFYDQKKERTTANNRKINKKNRREKEHVGKKNNL